MHGSGISKRTNQKKNNNNKNRNYVTTQVVIFWLKYSMDAREIIFLALQDNKTFQKHHAVGQLNIFWPFLSSMSFMVGLHFQLEADQ